MSFHSLYFRCGAEQTKARFAYIRKGRGIVMRHRPKEKNFLFSSEFRSGHAEQTIEEIKQ
jgi:hypothetical protein